MIYGGFAGTETARNQRDWAANLTTLSVGIGALNGSSDISYDVVTGSAVDGRSVLDGFLITDGNALKGGGGGIYNGNGSPMLANFTFFGNQARQGAGMHNSYSSPT